MTESATVIHATAVALQGRAVVIRGAAGLGKSGLALRMMACGAALVADDRVVLTRRGSALIAGCPAALRGLIEARGVGILRARPAGPSPVACVVDLDILTDDRLPPWHEVTYLGVVLPLLHRPRGIDLAPALLQYLRGGRQA